MKEIKDDTNGCVTWCVTHHKYNVLGLEVSVL